jgi:hypothetical protein
VEHDSFLREVEIQPNQTFLDFHHIILESAELLHCEKASFFNTDKKYKKDKEVSLKPEKRQFRKYDEDLDQVVTESVALPLMKAEKIKNYIDDPHQKLIYEFAGRDFFSFHIELYKIFQSDGITSYPRCIKRVGELPKKAEQPAPVVDIPAIPKVVAPKVPLPKLEILEKFDDIIEDDHELAAIENELDGLLDEAIEVDTPDTGEPEAGGLDDFMYGEGEESEDIEHMEHLEDFEDIENLDKRLSGFDRDSDEY